MNKQVWTPMCSRQALAVMKNLCNRAWLDGFMCLSADRIVAECGVGASDIAEVVVHLAEADLIAVRSDGTGTPVVEPRPILYALVQWLDSGEELAA